MTRKILLVDDDPTILTSYRRLLHKVYEVETAEDGQQGLSAIRRQGPFAAILADMRMPGMDGIEFLAQAAKLSPDSVRMMLTGHADFEVAVNAVNEGRIFRLLAKPCPSELLLRSMADAVEQYRVVKVEHDLLQRTLTGSVRVLTEILSLVNPAAFSRATHIRRYVRHMATELDLPQAWQFDLAAMLSQIGCVTLPPDAMEKIHANRSLQPQERRMYEAHPLVGRRLLENIPRLERIARMVEAQNGSYDESAQDQADDGVLLGSQMLRIALDFDRFLSQGLSHQDALGALNRQSHLYNPRVLATLASMPPDGLGEVSRKEVEVAVNELRVGMVACDEVHSRNGLLLVPKWQEITETLLVRLQNFQWGVGVCEPIRVRMADAGLAAG